MSSSQNIAPSLASILSFSTFLLSLAFCTRAVLQRMTLFSVVSPLKRCTRFPVSFNILHVTPSTPTWPNSQSCLQTHTTSNKSKNNCVWQRILLVPFMRLALQSGHGVPTVGFVKRWELVLGFGKLSILQRKSPQFGQGPQVVQDACQDTEEDEDDEPPLQQSSYYNTFG